VCMFVCVCRFQNGEEENNNYKKKF